MTLGEGNFIWGLRLVRIRLSMDYILAYLFFFFSFAELTTTIIQRQRQFTISANLCCLIFFSFIFISILNMSRHHPDLVMCRKQTGISIGRLCEKCDGKCPVCDSYVRPTTLVRICDECSFGNYQNKCVVCGGEGISDAFYCFECTRLEKDRDGCPKIINLGSSRTDLFFQRKSHRNQGMMG